MLGAHIVRTIVISPISLTAISVRELTVIYFLECVERGKTQIQLKPLNNSHATKEKYKNFILFTVFCGYLNYYKRLTNASSLVRSYSSMRIFTISVSSTTLDPCYLSYYQFPKHAAVDTMWWHLLPAEIRDMILDAVVEFGDNLAGAAAVSREWQHAIEPHTFAHIRLPVSRISQLNLMTQRNQSLVRSIWFCIELEEYDCTKCVNTRLSSIQTSCTDNELILEAFRLLFSALSTWGPNKGNLTLDISLYSNSDTEHAYKYLTFEPDVPGRATQHGVDQTSAVEHQDKHRWEAIESGLLVPPYGTLERLFADVWLPFDDERDCWEQAPKVQAVTRLVMRLQTRRRLQPNTVIQILSHLTGLHELHYELWRHHFDEMQEWLDEGKQSALLSLYIN